MAKNRSKTPELTPMTEGDDTVLYNEEIIKRNFMNFRPYIERCVKVTDLIVFYDLFTPDYPKVERILKGLLLPVGSEHRKTIKRTAKDIVQNLITKEILPHLLTRAVISQDDYEEISATERYYSTSSAAMELLLILPNRQKDWFRLFIEALLDSNHEDLAKIIDEELVKSIKETDLTVNYEASCQPADSYSPEAPSSQRSSGRYRAEKVSEGNDPGRINSAMVDCSPCKYGGISKEAEYFCHDCTEHFCETCKIFHGRMKVTRSHHVT